MLIPSAAILSLATVENCEYTVANKYVISARARLENISRIREITESLNILFANTSPRAYAKGHE